MNAPQSPRAKATAPVAIGQPWERYRTCCDCCHIKTGTAFLGVLEFAVVAGMLYGIVQQLMWKSMSKDIRCHKGILRDCLLRDFSHFSLTLVFDYIIALLLLFVLLSVLLMFCGIMSDTSCLLFPHLFIQAIFLLFSVGYFVLYAWSYFYGDLYTHKRSFEIMAFVERMWLASVLLICAALQVYLFFAVFKCTLYLTKVDHTRRERETAFIRLSERVRIAKENGLWRQGGVGGFLTYTRQEEDEKKKKEKMRMKTKEVGHVQWSSENKVVLLDETDEATRSEEPPIPPTVTFTPIEELPEEPRRRSMEGREEEGREGSPNKQRNASISSSKLSHAGSTKEKERHHHHHYVKRSESATKTIPYEPPKTSRSGDSPVKISVEEPHAQQHSPSPLRRKSSREEKLKEASLAAIAFDKARREHIREMIEAKERRMSASSSSPDKDSKERSGTIVIKAQKKTTDERPRDRPSPAEVQLISVTSPQHHHHHQHSGPSTSRDAEGEDSAEGRRRGSRQLRKLKSVESTDFEIPQEVFERRMKSRRRSSDAGRPHDEDRPHRSHHRAEKETRIGGPPSPTERKPHDSATAPILKKISISATVSPFA